MSAAKPTKYIFVLGGVMSGLGKGITASSIGYLLKNAGIRVTILKLDPYLNVDPGTMNPYQHGEVFVLDDGSETDLDLCHYERFIDIDMTKVHPKVQPSKLYRLLQIDNKVILNHYKTYYWEKLKTGPVRLFNPVFSPGTISKLNVREIE